MDGGTALNLVCDNRSWLVPVAATILPVGVFSAVSHWADRMPKPLAALVHALALNLPAFILLLSNSNQKATTPNA